MPDYSKTYLYKMIHIENIQHILQNGITHSSPLQKPSTAIKTHRCLI